MKHLLPPEILEATRLTKAGRLGDATAAIQRLLGGHRGSGDDPADAHFGPTIDGVAEREPPADNGPDRVADFHSSASHSSDFHSSASHSGVFHSGEAGGIPAFGPAPREAGHAGLRERLRGLFHKTRSENSRSDGPAGQPTSAPAPHPAPHPAPGQSRFLTGEFSNPAGTRPYKLYVPSGYRGQAVPLIVMLHGCTQSPDDFAAGTRMNAAAEENTCIVAWPGQVSSANLRKCWNWFNANDQQRDKGEPSLIAGIAGQVMRGYAIDPRRVYVAGLSAGGAAAAVMGDAYPDIFAAIGVHSGLASGAASDVSSALTAMRTGNGGLRRGAPGQTRSSARPVIPTIVFHGDQDTTVNFRNAESVVAQAAGDLVLVRRAEQGKVTGGHAFSRIVHEDGAGQTVIEQWVIHGAGHAWSGGSGSGSFTDSHGPDATREMLRFFLEHPRQDAG